MVGGVAHNAGPILVAVFVVENIRVSYYFSVLAITGMITGIVIGILGGTLTERISKSVIGKDRNSKK